MKLFILQISGRALLRNSGLSFVFYTKEIWSAYKAEMRVKIQGESARYGKIKLLLLCAWTVLELVFIKRQKLVTTKTFDSRERYQECPVAKGSLQLIKMHLVKEIPYMVKMKCKST